jgi:hypothetical protein
VLFARFLKFFHKVRVICMDFTTVKNAEIQSKSMHFTMYF